MGSFSLWHWIVAFLFGAIFLIPGWRIVQRTGFHGAWALLLLVPFVSVIAYWVFAFIEWPRDRSQN